MKGFLKVAHDVQAGLVKLEKQGKLETVLDREQESARDSSMGAKKPTVKGKYGSNKGGTYTKKLREVQSLTMNEIIKH